MKSVLKMNKNRAKELLEPLYADKAQGISKHWQARMIEALEYVIENETIILDGETHCPECHFREKHLSSCKYK